jgi:hypothetical protein
MVCVCYVVCTRQVYHLHVVQKFELRVSIDEKALSVIGVLALEHSALCSTHQEKR